MKSGSDSFATITNSIIVVASLWIASSPAQANPAGSIKSTSFPLASIERTNRKNNPPSTVLAQPDGGCATALEGLAIAAMQEGIKPTRVSSRSFVGLSGPLRIRATCGGGKMDVQIADEQGAVRITGSTELDESTMEMTADFGTVGQIRREFIVGHEYITATFEGTTRNASAHAEVFVSMEQCRDLAHNGISCFAEAYDNIVGQPEAINEALSGTLQTSRAWRLAVNLFQKSFHPASNLVDRDEASRTLLDSEPSHVIPGILLEQTCKRTALGCLAAAGVCGCAAYIPGCQVAGGSCVAGAIGCTVGVGACISDCWTGRC